MWSVTLGLALTLLALVSETSADAAFRNALKAPSLDIYPHPAFIQINCTKFEKVLEQVGDVCPEEGLEYGMYPPEDREDDARVCTEYRIWYPSHCVMMSKHCTLDDMKFNLIGMCHRPPPGEHGSGYHHRIPYRACDGPFQKLRYNPKYSYCPHRLEHICGTYMKSYRSACHFEHDWCTNHQHKRNWEVAKVLKPKILSHHQEMMDRGLYTKCQMYSPIAHKNHFVDYHDFTNGKKLKEMVKYDHVCKNTGKESFDSSKGKLDSNAYTARRYYDDNHLAKQSKSSPDGCATPKSEEEKAPTAEEEVEKLQEDAPKVEDDSESLKLERVIEKISEDDQLSK